MTCIVAVEDPNGKVYMGADSCSYYQGRVQESRIEKVFKPKKSPQFLIGCSPSFRLMQLLKYQLEVEANNTYLDNEEYLVAILVPALKKLFDQNGLTRIDQNVEYGDTFLLGFKGTIYKIDSDFQINSSTVGFQALGSGEEFALGSLFTTAYYENTKHRVEIALQAAARFCASVSEPFSIYEL